MYGKKSLVFGLILSGLPVVAAAEQLVLGIIGDTTRIAYLDKTFLQPFTKSTGISVKIASISENDGGDEVELFKRASREKWDFLTLDEAQALRLCAAGDLAPTGTMRQRQNSLLPEISKAVTCHSFKEPRTETIVYNLNAYQRDIPDHISAFFDLERFPGKRAVALQAPGLLEMALMAQGVPASQVYHLLSTTRGMELAIGVFAQVKSQIIWTDDHAEAESLLADGSATMGLIETGAKTDGDATAPPESVQPLNRLGATSSIAHHTSWIPTAAGDGSVTALGQFIEYAEQANISTVQLGAGIHRDARWFATVSPNIKTRLDGWSATLQ